MLFINDAKLRSKILNQINISCHPQSLGPFLILERLPLHEFRFLFTFGIVSIGKIPFSVFGFLLILTFGLGPKGPLALSGIF